MTQYNEKYYQDNIHGHASWADYNGLKKDDFFKSSGLQLGHFEQSPLYSDHSGAIVTIAGAQSGKGRDILLYNVCNYRGSMLIHDPKGEQYAVSLMHQHKLGIKAYGLNPFSMHGLPSHATNLLDLLTADSKTLYSDCQIIVENFISVSPREPSFDTRAQEWLKFIMIALLQTHKSITLPRVFDAVNSIEGDPAAFHANVLEPMQSIDTKGAAIAAEIMTKQTQAPKEFTAIMSSLNGAFIWMEPALRDMLSGSDVSMKDLCGRKKTKIFIMLPAEMITACAPLIRLMFSIGMIHKQRKPNAPRVVYLVDEAGQLGRFPELLKSLTYGAGCGVRTWAVFQDTGQIMENFGEQAITTFLGSAQTRQFFGVGDERTATMISNMLGKQTLHYDNSKEQRQAAQSRYANAQGILRGQIPIEDIYHGLQSAANMHHQDRQSRPLLTPEEILNLQPDRQILMVRDVTNGTILGHKYPFFTRRSMAGKYMPNPYYKPKHFVKVKGGFFFGYAPVIPWFKPIFKRHYLQFQKGRKIVVRAWL